MAQHEIFRSANDELRVTMDEASDTLTFHVSEAANRSGGADIFHRDEVALLALLSARADAAQAAF